MYISKVKIENFKCFKDTFTLELTEGLNIIVGNNEAGKSTILEAVHLALSGLYAGRYLKNELSEYLFNNETLNEYKTSLQTDNPLPPPEISIEVFIKGDDVAIFEGDGNSEKKSESSFKMKIALAEKYNEEYADYIKTMKENEATIPIEYYEITWTTSARETITTRRIPIKSALVDSTSNRFQNGSDVYISHIIKNHLDEKQKNTLIQAHRKLQTSFAQDEAVLAVNKEIEKISKETEEDKQVKLSVDLSSKNAWENSFLTYVEDIPFHHIGKGEQSIVKTKLALQHKKVKEANLILLEEPENHLAHARLYQLIKDIESKCTDKQIIISTHSSFVANKLGLDKLIILNDKKTARLNALQTSTQEFFRKIPGYDTLRLILCKKAILVEGDSDELAVQKAFMQKNGGKLPIEREIDIISVGMSFLRFLEIAEKINKPVAVVTDNDGDVDALKKKYANYIGDNKKPNIDICFDETIDEGPLVLNGKPFNYNTLEPKLLKANGEDKIRSILSTDKTGDELHAYMKANKTDCALKVFDTTEEITFPEYILNALS